MYHGGNVDPIAHYARQYGTASADNDRSIVRSYYPRLVKKDFYVKSILANLVLEKNCLFVNSNAVDYDFGKFTQNSRGSKWALKWVN